MKILYVAMKHDYGIPERGLSFEHYNFYDTLVRMKHEVEYFDFFLEHQTHGREVMTKMLKHKVEEYKPDLMFTFLFSDQFDHAILKSITDEKKTITFNWFADDHWRFDTFSKIWAPCFSFVSTTDVDAIAKYRASGYANALLTQWGANPDLYKKGSEPNVHTVTFVGQAYGDRPDVIRSLRDRGVKVRTWGTNWNVRIWHRAGRKLRLISPSMFERVVNSSRISQDEMIRVFQSSRINLNLSAASAQTTNQIKGRNFEIPACGGFQLSGYAERLAEFFEIDKEIVCYRSRAELAEKVSYYLDHEDQRKEIAEAGYRRVLRDHTYEQRLTQLFRQMHLA